MSTVVAPAAGFSGTVAGVQFVDGQAETEDARALAYFRRKGYEVDGERREQPAPPEPPDPRHLGDGKVGTPLRDAAVDPRPGDRGVAWKVERAADGTPRPTSPVPVIVDETGRVVGPA